MVVTAEFSTARRPRGAPLRSWNTGYHLFDNPTGTLVIDGERTPLDHCGRNQPGISETRVALPPEPGEYSIYISAMQEHVAWLYEKGSRFILIDVAVSDDGVLTLRRFGKLPIRIAVCRRASGPRVSARP